MHFYKYQGTGNDFILIDNRSKVFDIKRRDLVKKLCDRRFGIGADGLMLLQNTSGYDFEMVYYNSDGNPSSMCGNGGRCIANFAHRLGIVKNKTKFLAIDGAHEAIIEKDIVKLKMNDVSSVETGNDHYFLNTGSPHYVKFVNDTAKLNVFEEGRKVRYSERFKAEGTNVNFVEKQDGKIVVRTYERGVEAETLSCGTGVTASALIARLTRVATADEYCEVKTPGGNLIVRFKKGANNTFTDIWLEGSAEFVFEGEVETGA